MVTTAYSIRAARWSNQLRAPVHVALVVSLLALLGSLGVDDVTAAELRVGSGSTGIAGLQLASEPASLRMSAAGDLAAQGAAAVARVQDFITGQLAEMLDVSHAARIRSRVAATRSPARCAPSSSTS